MAQPDPGIRVSKEILQARSLLPLVANPTLIGDTAATVLDLPGGALGTIVQASPQSATVGGPKNGPACQAGQPPEPPALLHPCEDRHIKSVFL